MSLDLNALAGKILPELVKLDNKAAITEAAITAAIDATSGLSDEEKGATPASLVTPAKNGFAAAVQTLVTDTIRGNLNTSFGFKPDDRNVEIELNGLTPKQIKIGGKTHNITPGTTLEIKDGSNTVAKITVDGGKLKITDITDASKISNIELLKYEFKGETITPAKPEDKIEIGIKENPLDAITGTLDKGEVTLALPKGAKELTEADVKKLGGDLFDVTKDGTDKLKFKLKDGKAIEAGKTADVKVEVEIGGKKTTVTYTISPKADAAAAEKGTWQKWGGWIMGGLGGLGVIASFLMPKDGESSAGGILGIIGGVLLGGAVFSRWLGGIFGVPAEETKPADKPAPATS